MCSRVITSAPLLAGVMLWLIGYGPLLGYHNEDRSVKPFISTPIKQGIEAGGKLNVKAANGGAYNELQRAIEAEDSQMGIRHVTLQHARWPRATGTQWRHWRVLHGVLDGHGAFR